MHRWVPTCHAPSMHPYGFVSGTQLSFIEGFQEVGNPARGFELGFPTYMICRGATSLYPVIEPPTSQA